MLLQHKQRVIAGLTQLPTAIGSTGQDHKAMQEVIASIGIRFDVVEQHPLGRLKFWQGWSRIQSLHESIPLGPGLGHQGGCHRAVLFSEAFELIRQASGISSRKVLEALDAQVLKHFAALRPNATDLTEMTSRRRLGVAQPPPTAERAFTAISRQGGGLGAAQIARQLAQGVIQLFVQCRIQGQPFLLQTTPRTSHGQRLWNGSLLEIGQKPSCQSQG